jgi:hypothetical protein
MTVSGFFVDWDGNVRRVDKPGSGYTCSVRDFGGSESYKRVDVVATDLGHVVFQATHYDTLAAIEALVPGLEVLLVTHSGHVDIV